MDIEFPITLGALATVVGIAFLGAILGLWFKRFLPDWRWTPLFVLALCLLAALAARIVAAGWPPSAEGLLVALLVGFFGASLAVFGYEAIANALGTLGAGPRSEEAQLSKARALLERSGYSVAPSIRPR